MEDETKLAERSQAAKSNGINAMLLPYSDEPLRVFAG